MHEAGQVAGAVSNRARDLVFPLTKNKVWQTA